MDIIDNDRTVKGDTAGEVVYVPSYYYEDNYEHEVLLFCNACRTSTDRQPLALTPIRN